MENPLNVNVTLNDGVDQNSFVSEFDSNSNVELLNLLPELTNLVLLKVEKDYLSTLQSHSSVKSAQVEESIEEMVTYPSIPSRLTLSNKSAGGNSTQAGSRPGTDFISLQHYLDCDLITSDSKIGNHSTLDDYYNTESGTNTQGDWSSIYLGRNVDIVAIEAGSVQPNNDFINYHNNHPECKDLDTNAVRTIPIAWGDYGANSGSVNTTQVSNNLMFNSHGFKTMSVSIGNVGGWAKKANFHVMYLGGGDGILSCCNAIKSWHNAKSVNSSTGLKNPTIVLTEWHSPASSYHHSIKISEITSITDPVGGTTNRPSGGWGNDLTPFISRYMLPRMLLDPTDGTWHWVISTAGLAYGSSDHDPTNGQSSYRSAFTDLYNAGIPVFTSGGNAGSIYVKDDDSRSLGTYFDVNSGAVLYSFGYNSSGDQNDPGTVSKGTTTVTRWYPLRPDGPHGNPNTIHVAAGGNSEASPTLDRYTSRGPGVDLIGKGVDTFCAEGPGGTLYTNGARYNFYGGNSCAVPTVVGKAACFMEKHYVLNGVYPTPDQLKSMMIAESRRTSIHADTTTWSNVPTASATALTNQIPADHYGTMGTQYLEINANRTSPNGGLKFVDHLGTPNHTTTFNNKAFNREQTYKERPRTGVLFPRPRKFDLDPNGTYF